MKHKGLPMDSIAELKKQDFTLIAKNNNLNGEFHLSGEIQIASEISGKLFVSENGRITFERTSSFNGELLCEDVEIFGKFKGILESTGKVVIRSSAQVDGRISAQHITIYPGAEVNIEGHTLENED